MKPAAGRKLDGICSKEDWNITQEILGNLEGYCSENGKNCKSTECQGIYLGANKQKLHCKRWDNQ